MNLDSTDKAIINQLQGGFPLCSSPYREAAKQIGISEQDLLQRLQRLLEEKALSRFGPMYHAERMGGALSLCAMRVPESDFERVAERVNAHPEVAHNYARDHEFSMWFVAATETLDDKRRLLETIEQETGYPVYDMPKEREFFVGLRFDL